MLSRNSSLRCCAFFIVLVGIGLAGCSQQRSENSANSPAPQASPTASATSAPTNGIAAASPTPSLNPASATTPGKDATASAPAIEKPQPPRTFTLPAGSTLAVYTSKTLSTKTDQDGETFTASLAKPIVDGDWVIAKKGAAVEGRVINADPGGKVKGLASISVALTHLTLSDGRRVELATSSYTQHAKASKKKDAMKIGIGAGIGAAIGAIAGGGKGAAIGAGAGGAAGTGYVLSTRGNPAVIPGEALLSFRLKSPISVVKQ